MGANAREMSFSMGGGGGRGGAAGRGGPGRGGPGGPAAGGGRGGPPAGGVPAAAPAAEPAVDAQSARIFWVARRIAEYQREQGANAYVYWFTQSSPAPEGNAPSQPVHASEVKYVFDNLGELPLFPDSSDAALAALSADDRRVADLLASYWGNFAASGKPNGRGLPEWRVHTGRGSVRAAILDSDPASEVLPPLDMMQSQEEALQQQLEALR
jgi:carboxylesterase type B